MSEGRRRYIAPGYILAYLRRRWYYVAVILSLLTIVAILLVISSSLADYGENLSLNLVADLIGVIIVLFVIAPFIERAELRRDSVLKRFNHHAFIRQVADARRRIVILETWTELLEGSCRDPFLKSLQAALDQNVEVRILLLDPDAKAAEQRRADLLQRTNVVDNIMGNLQALYKLRNGLPEQLRGNIEVRIYSALPPVQMYCVDDRIVVSFFPLNITSWNAVQHQTSTHAQLGTFVSEKFDELWDAPSTRTLDHFWAITVKVGSGENEKPYQVPFVKSDEELYVRGGEIADGHLNSGVGSLRARLFENGHEEPGLYSFLHLNTKSEHWRTIQELFARKYGQERREVILKLVKTPSE